ncbi:MAG: BspA family leucine-rich repeat surface protein [Coriobacteriia bacterium]|nr:BspA family leucine-rich repeat surface protein [Coriobacteriia bacterium]
MKNIKMKLFVSLCSICALAFCISMCVIGLNQTGEADKPSQFAQSESTTTSNNIQEQHALKNNSQTLSSQACVPENIADKPSGHVVKIDSSEMEKIVNDYQEDVVNVKSNISTNLFRQKTDPDDIGWRIDKDSEGYNVLHVGKPENYHNTFESTFAEYQLHGWYNWRTMIDKVVIDEEVSFKSCKSLFGCIDKDTSGSVKLMDIRQFEGLDKIDLTDSKFNGDASYMFVGCDWANTNSLPKGLENVTNAKAMFNYTAVSEAKQGNGFSNDIMHKAAFELTGATNLEFALANNKLFKDFDGSKLKYDDRDFNMSYMLYNDPKVLEIDIRGWTSFPKDKEKSEMWTGKIINEDDVYVYCDATIRETVSESLPQPTSTGHWKLEEPTAWWGVSLDGQTLYLSALQTDNAKEQKKEILDGGFTMPWASYANITSVVVEGNIHLKFNNTSWLFYDNLKKAKTFSGLDKFDVSRVTDFSYMFCNCESLTNLNLSSFNTARATTFKQMFIGCKSLTEVNLTSFNTEKVSNFSFMFYGCSSLTQLDLSSFSSSPNANLSQTFCDCKNLTTIKANSSLWKRETTLSGFMPFEGCTNLVGHSKTGHSTPFTSDDVKYAFVDVDDENPGYFTDIDYDPRVAKAVVYQDNDNKDTLMEFVYDENTYIPGATIEGHEQFGKVKEVYNIKYSSSYEELFPEWIHQDGEEITSLVQPHHINFAESFKDAKYCYNKDAGHGGEPISNLDFYFASMKNFVSNGDESCVTGWNNIPSKVERLISLLMGAKSADSKTANLDLTECTSYSIDEVWDMLKGTEFNGNLVVGADSFPGITGYENHGSPFSGSYFTNCIFNENSRGEKYGRNIENFTLMFAGDEEVPHSYKSLDLTNVDFSHATSFNIMFSNLHELKNVKFNPNLTLGESLTSLMQMFSGCNALEYIDLSFIKNTSNITDVYGMFSGCTNLQKIIVDSNWALTDACESSKHMFEGCTSLAGAKGTSLNNIAERSGKSGDDLTNKTFAKIDNYDEAQGGVQPDACGYFTGPTAPVEPDYCCINIDDDTATADTPATLSIIQEASDDKLDLSYKIDDGKWIKFNSEEHEDWFIEHLVKGNKVYLKGENYFDDNTHHAGFASNIDIYGEKYILPNKISVNKKFRVSGEATSLVYGDLTDESIIRTIPGDDGCFAWLFGNMDDSANLLSVNSGFLPFTTLKSECYKSMFDDCTGLTTIPEGLLPAENLTWGCYEGMFYSCIGLTTIPEGLLPAKNISAYCYSYMFENCTSLEKAPDLMAPIDELDPQITSGCYSSMFNGCSSLKEINVGFKKFPKEGDSYYTSTDSWMNGVASTGIFNYIGEGTPEYTDGDYGNPDAIPWAKPAPIDWKPMQAEAAGEDNPIDFYPAFNSASEVAGYKFAVKNGDAYIEIPMENITMAKIYEALQPTEGEKTTTLYYHKVDESAPALKCYTTRDMAWNKAFEGDQGGHATSYASDFVTKYQKDKSGNNNGIETAQLSDKFGSSWNAESEYDKFIPLINEVEYGNADNDSGFYFSYGQNNGRLLSPNSFQLWGNYHATGGAMVFYVLKDFKGWWTMALTSPFAVVLAKEFGATQPSTHEVSVEPVEEGHGTITGGPFDVPEGTSYTVDNVNKKITIGSGDDKVIQYTDGDDWIFDKWMIGEKAAESGTVTGDIMFKAQTKEKPALKPLTVDDHQYFPVAGNSLSDDITFYDADGNELSKTGAGGKYQQSDLTGATQYSGTGSFKTLRSIPDIWDNTFYIESEGSATTYPCEATGVKDSFKRDHLVDGTEDTEQVYRFNGKEGERTNPAEYEGVSLTDIWKAYNPGQTSDGFGGQYGCFWSSWAKSSGQYGEAYRWGSRANEWDSSKRIGSTGNYVLVCREFNPKPITYSLKTDENGEWKEGDTTVTSITVAGGEKVPKEEQTITYKGTDGNSHTVTATPNGGYVFDNCSYDVGTKTFFASFRRKSLTVDGHQYFPVAGDSLSSDITFYDAAGNELLKTGADGKYQQSDLGGTKEGTTFCASFYTGDGSFKTLRSIDTLWSNAFVDNSSGSYPYSATEITETLKNKLVGGTEDTEQVYRLNGNPSTRGTKATYEGVSLTDIWNAYNPGHSSSGFGGATGCFWSSCADNKNNAYLWNSNYSGWRSIPKGNPGSFYVLVCREFNPKQKKSLTVDDHQYFPVAGDSLSDDITFYDAAGNELKKTGAGGKYQQSDLGGTKEGTTFCASSYTGEGSFKTLRSIKDSWNNTFYIENEGQATAYPSDATGVKETFIKDNLVGGTEDTEQVYRLNGNPSGGRTDPAEYEGVSLTDIWKAYNPGPTSEGFGGQYGCFLSSCTETSKKAFRWNSAADIWSSINNRSDTTIHYVLVCRTFQNT